MANQNYKGLFEHREIGVATNVISKFRRQWTCLRLEGFDDLLQECLMCWDSAKAEYDSSTGVPWQKFMSKIIENKLYHIIEKLTSDKRKVFTKTVSLDERISDEEGSPTYSEQLPADEDCASNLRVIIGLKIDISQAMQKLTSEQKKICHLLGEEGLNIMQASKILGKPRTTLYEEIRRIRAVFQKENLQEYL